VTRPRVLVTGGAGQLASDLRTQLVDRADVHAPARTELDITDFSGADRVLDDLEPQVVINCAAFHNVDECERNPQRAWEVNVLAVQHLAARCSAHGARLVHLSTNYVFDGQAEEPYTEEDLPAPGSWYALTKLAGEHAALGYCREALVVRTAGLYGHHGSESKGGNFVQRMIGRARRGETLRVVADQRLTPTFTSDLAAGVLEAAERRATGILHITNSGSCSWHEFTVAIMEAAQLEVTVEPSLTDQSAGVSRPMNGVLTSARAEPLGLSPLPHWRDALERYIRSSVLQPTA
jgi:dTDP-4-dehydrorhamnose reductase